MTLATKFLSLSPEQRGLVFEQAAAGLAGHDVILEKDFWVSWLLGLLFAQPKLAPFLVFKGGTSLSKVFGVIDRHRCESRTFGKLGFQGRDMLESVPSMRPAP